MHNGNLITISRLKKDIKKFQILRFLNKINIYKHSRKKNTNNVMQYDIRKENIVLHGCCLIFSQMFISKFNELPVISKFYYEEEILYLYARKNNLTTIYCPNVKIFHLQKVSTSKSTKSNKKKNEFILNNLIISGKALLKELKKMENKENE